MSNLPIGMWVGVKFDKPSLKSIWKLKEYEIAEIVLKNKDKGNSDYQPKRLLL